MGIYIFNYISLPIYEKLLSRKNFIRIACFQMFMILALRSNSLGVDLSNYRGGFEYIQTLTFANMISRLHFVRLAELIYPFAYESGYVLLNWIFSHLGLGFHSLLVFCALINMYAIGRFVYRYSQIPWLSLSIMCAFGTFQYMFGIIRQSLAFSIILFAIIYADEEKWKRSGMLMLLAFTFQRAAILAIPLLIILLKVKRLNRGRYIKAFVMWAPFLVISSFVYKKIIFPIMIFFEKGYEGHDLQVNNLIVLLIIIVMAIILFGDFSIVKNKIDIMSIWAVMMAVYLETFGMFNDNFARSVQFYSAFIMIVVPFVIKNYKDRRVSILTQCMVYFLLFGFMVYSFYEAGIIPYKFYFL